jgi:hypothetical protein
MPRQITIHAVERKDIVRLMYVQTGMRTGIMLTISCAQMRIAGKNQTIMTHVAQCREVVVASNVQKATYTGTIFKLYFARAGIAIKTSIKIFVACQRLRARPTTARIIMGMH